MISGAQKLGRSLNRGDASITRCLAAVASVTVALLAFVATASATITHNVESFSPLTGSGSSVTIHRPSAVGIDQATGNVFLADGTESGNQVVILGGEGGAPLGLSSPFAIGGFNFANEPTGVAFVPASGSPGDGTLYVADTRNHKVKKFVRDSVAGQYVPASEPELHASPPFGEVTGVAVGPTGEIFVSDYTNESIVTFDATGVETGRFRPSACPFSTPGSIALDSSGDLFLQCFGGVRPTFKWPANASGELEPGATPVEVPTPGFTSGVAVDRSTNRLYVTLKDRVLQYDAATLEPKDSTTHQPLAEFGLGVLSTAEGLGVNEATGRIYVADVGSEDVAVFGPAVLTPTVSATPASNITGTKATLNGAVNPENIAVTDCFFEWGQTSSYGNVVPCDGLPPGDSTSHPVSANIAGLLANGTSYHYRLVAENENGVTRSGDRTLATAETVVTEAASDIGSSTAALHGLLRPEGVPFTDCAFEYRLTTETTFHDAPCEPAAGEIEPDFAEHAVSAQLTGLQANSSYEVRLRATNAAATHFGDLLTFGTVGPPQISEVRARDATENSVVLEGKVNPSGFATSWRFEWGPTAAYGHVAQVDFETPIGAGNEPVPARVELTGLSAGSSYHYRLIASSGENRFSASADQIAETLNPCGLPDQRCLEMVSPRQLGPVAAPGRSTGGTELLFQAGSSSAGALAYTIESGLPDATRGGNVLYLGQRNAGNEVWDSAQYSAPILAPDEKQVSANPSYVFALSPDLRCGVIASSQPLTADASGRQVIEAGGANLYRRNPDASYDLITYLPPNNLEAVRPDNSFENYRRMVGMSADCSRVVFESDLHYPGIDGVGEWRLYEWHEGTLSSLGVVPTASGEAAAEVSSEPAGTANHLNALSGDGSTVFFTATRLYSNNAAEIGKKGVFARIDGSRTVDISASETATGDTGAKYQGATPDGSRVYFTANSGLTPETSAAGTDLYQYDFSKPEGERLTDLSVSQEAGGAEVAGVLGFANDGSHVYFAARAQLLPGSGSTREQNVDDGTYSVYDWSAGTVRFVGTVTVADVRGSAGGSAVLASDQTGFQNWRSRVTADGRYLLFESSARVTSYESEGEHEAYLYDAGSAGEATICISCRQDGKPPIPSPARGLLHSLAQPANLLSTPMSLAVKEGEPQAFFVSKEKLATGGVQGTGNLYEWSHGQIFHIATEPVGALPEPQQIGISFVGASADGGNLYFYSAGALNWENPQGRPAAWDARSGGGFLAPQSPPQGCNPAGEGSCQAPSSAPPSPPGAGSATFNGPGNVKPKVKHNKRHQKAHRKHHRKSAKGKRHAKPKQAKGKHRKGKQARKANANRRAGK